MVNVGPAPLMTTPFLGEVRLTSVLVYVPASTKMVSPAAKELLKVESTLASVAFGVEAAVPLLVLEPMAEQ